MMMRRILVPAIATALLLGACGNDKSGDTVNSADSKMDDMTATTAARARSGQADRIIEVRMVGGNRFVPDTIEVKKGEIISFKLLNEDDTLHEFMLGDEAMQADHEKEMMDMGSQPMKMDDEADGVTVDPGKTKTLTWTFADAGTVLYGCHQPGHYAEGMKGTITVS